MHSSFNFWQAGYLVSDMECEFKIAFKSRTPARNLLQTKWWIICKMFEFKPKVKVLIKVSLIKIYIKK